MAAAIFWEQFPEMAEIFVKMLIFLDGLLS